MKEQKHIDRLFQERFKEFDVKPPAKVWNNIEAELQKKEKEDRKLIPIWWRVAGIAALLALLFTVGGLVFNSNSENPIVETNNLDLIPETNAKEVIDSEGNNNLIPEVADSDKAKTPDQEENGNEQLNTPTNSEAVANGADDRTVKKQINSNLTADKTNTGFTTGANTASAVANTDNSSNKDNTGLDVQETGVTINKEAANSLLDNTTQDAVTSVKDQVTGDKTGEEQDSELTEDGKVSLIDYLKEKEEADAVAQLDNNSVPANRWSVAPQVAPVFYSSLAEGSSVGNEFTDNAKSSDANLSYGVQVQYNVNDRFALRSGVSKVNLSYNTNDIEFAVTPNTLGLTGTKFNAGGITYAVGDKGTLENRFTAAAPTVGLDNVNLNSFEGLLNQQLAYWEVPLEASYALINNRFKLNVVGGVSTLFLQDNTLKAISGAREANLGSLDNLNDLSFTTNVGLGLQYNISKRFAVNVEPMFKYQLNPYSDSSVNFRPFYMGVYSGLSIKF